MSDTFKRFDVEAYRAQQSRHNGKRIAGRVAIYGLLLIWTFIAYFQSSGHSPRRSRLRLMS